MFDYSDPTGGTVLDSTGAISIYRQLVDQAYQGGISVTSSEFISLEALTATGETPAIVDVDWPAFPLSNAGTPDAVIDDNRAILQDEYVEWRVEEDANGAVTKITFTTLFPEYFISLGTVSEAALVEGIQDILPGASPTTAELFGTDVATQLDSPQKRFDRLRTFWSNCPWNDGTKGMLSLVQPANTLGALTFLAGNCAVPRPSVPIGSVCTGPFCGPGRNSDPQICARLQSAIRSGSAVTLADPIGIEFLQLKGDWELDGSPVPNINADPELWAVSHGGHRAVLNVPAGLTLAGDRIVSGTQVSRVLFVKARALGVPATSLPISPATPALLVRRT